MFQAVYLKLLYSIFGCIFFSANLKAQNLFVNTDFETLNNCIEYHQDCSPEAWFYIKPAITPLINNSVVPKPFSGKDLLVVPVENVYSTVNKRTFIYTMFCCPLQKDKKYKLAFYINTAGNSFYGVDFYMSNKEFTSYNFYPDSVKPSIHISQEDIVNELSGWNYVETIYTAKGDEKFFLLGNLNSIKFDFVSYQRMNKAGDVFYFIDDISFSSLLPQTLCEEYKKNTEKLYAQNLRHSENALVEKIGLNNILTDTITVPSVFFETDKDVLKPSFKKLIDELVFTFRNKNITSIQIEGHTDNTGAQERNIVLSRLRAESVKKYLIKKEPKISNNIFAEGKAAAFPIAENATEKGRAKNRRVQIIISYTNK
ncbi:MAG: OmpA family protein [Ferruginibacter sp.]|nr:OmpA family protein [Ferruginibacter sp.]